MKNCFIFTFLFFSIFSFGIEVEIKDNKMIVDGKPFYMKGICYHPVKIGKTKRSFESLTEDLILIKEAGINTLRVYEPIDDIEVLDELQAAGIKVVISFGYNQKGRFDIVSGTFIQGIGILTSPFDNNIKKFFPNLPDNYSDKIEKHFPIELDECSKTREVPEMLATHREYMQNSLLSFVTETQFYYDAWFPTEKIFKTFSFGHPFILLGCRGLVRCLKNLGFRVDLCGIDHTYDSVADPEKRAEMAHKELVKWCKLSREEKIIRIEKSMDDMRYNFELSHSLKLYEDTVLRRIFLP